MDKQCGPAATLHSKTISFFLFLWIYYLCICLFGGQTLPVVPHICLWVSLPRDGESLRIKLLDSRLSSGNSILVHQKIWVPSSSPELLGSCHWVIQDSNWVIWDGQIDLWDYLSVLPGLSGILSRPFKIPETERIWRFLKLKQENMRFLCLSVCLYVCMSVFIIGMSLPQDGNTKINL